MATRPDQVPLDVALNDIAALARIDATIEALDPRAAPTGSIIAAPRAIHRPARHVAVVAGSFNPLTRAHLALARAALEVGADGVYLALSRHTVDKGEIQRPTLADRALVLATHAREHNRLGVLVYNRGLYADQAVAARQLFTQADHVSLVMGFDKIVQIFDRHYYHEPESVLDRLFGAVDLLVAPRGSSDVAALRLLLEQGENRRFAPRVHPLPLDSRYAYDSATRVRQLAAASLPVNELVPAETAAFLTLANPYLAPREAPGGLALDAYSVRQERLHAYRSTGAKS